MTDDHEDKMSRRAVAPIMECEQCGVIPPADHHPECMYADPFVRLCDKLLWRPIDTAPQDAFILLYCAEDRSRWLAKWQDARWYGVDDMGLTREGYSAGDPEVVTGWAVNCWMPLPDPPYQESDSRS